MQDLEKVFAELRSLMLPFASEMVRTHDTDRDFSVDTTHVMKNGKPLFFGAVNLKKSYVSYHLMPVYVNPALLDGMSPRLRKRMQGKSCFNFTDVDPELFDELKSLTSAGFDDYRRQGFV